MRAPFVAVGVVMGVLAIVPAAPSRVLSAAPSTLPASRPHIVLIVTDDQGYGDLGRHGNPVLKTPHLDRLYDQSVRLTDHYVSPTCSPTRAALMTGRHEFHSGVTHTIQERERLSLRATTIAQVLRDAGYTTGVFGKWHLGDETPYRPNQRGFQTHFIHGAGGIGQTFPGSCGDAPGNRYFDPVVLHNGQFEATRGYCTDVFFSAATAWIQQVHQRGPFFCLLATNAPHEPLDCPPEYIARYADQVASDAEARFFGMLANIDDNVGRLLAQLDSWDLARQTLVIFMNDNGGTAGVRIWNAGMRGRKVTTYRGGTRGIALLRWPGTLVPGDVRRTTAHLDLFPTLAELAGAKLPTDLALDGRSLLPLLGDPAAPWPDRYLFTHVGRWPAGQARAARTQQTSVRYGRFEAVCTTADRWELFDLQTDPGQSRDLAAAEPARLADLVAAHARWWESILPDLDNEQAHATAPAINPFKARYWRQFRGPGPNGVEPPSGFSLDDPLP